MNIIEMIRLFYKYYKMLELLKISLPEEIIHIIFEYICYDDEKIEFFLNDDIQRDESNNSNLTGCNTSIPLYISTSKYLVK